MAEPGRTVRVSGLPADTEEGKLKDKLFIHFLRARNGGGEIDSITFIKETPVCALVTFEDSGVAQRVIQRSRHLLEVDGKTYKITVTEHSKSVDPDKVILSLTAIVNYSQLPGGTMALTSLQKGHRDVQINYDATKKVCILNGAYSKVQAALAQLLDHEEKGYTGLSGTSDFTSVATQRSHFQESEESSRKPKKQKEKRDIVQVVRPSDEYNSRSYRDLTPGGNGWEDTGQVEGASLHPTTPEEDFSLIVDSDMFQYLQKHCQKDYQHILRQYAVDVVDLTNQGLTTLFLQNATGAREGGHNEERLTLAREAISRLYQENETTIRRAQLPKNMLSPRGALQRAVENLRVILPKLLLNEDEKNIYIIGSSSDVSEAKQYLLFDHGEEKSKKEDAASLLNSPSYNLGSSAHSEEHHIVTLPVSSPVDSPDDGMDWLLRSEENDKRAEGTRKYKLAARFKDSGLAPLGDRLTGFTLRGLSSPSSGDGVSRALAHNTGGDILFKSRDASTALLQNKISLNPHLLNDTRPKSLTSPFSTTGSTHPPPGVSGSTLKRASSFSGTPQQKVKVTDQKSQDDSGRSTVRVRSSSFSNQSDRNEREVYNVEIIVSSMMWMHIKEAYSTRLKDLTSDVQIKESILMGSSDLTVTVRGANSAKVSSCQLALQKLVDSVSVDFSEHELRLSELGITDRADENLIACCAEVRSRLKKISFQIFEKSLYLLGPKELCSQVSSTLQEIFSAEIPEQQDSSGPFASKWNPSAFIPINEDQSSSLQTYTHPQRRLESQTTEADGNGNIQEKTTNHTSHFHEAELTNGPTSQKFVRTDPVINEKVKSVGTVKSIEQNSELFLNSSKTEIDAAASLVNGVTSSSITTTTATTTCTDNKDTGLHKKERTVHSTKKDRIEQRQRKEIQDTLKESGLGVGGLGWICVCGESKKLMTKTKCGTTLCSKCLDNVHAHCRVCHDTKLTLPWGIQGKMKYSKLHIKVPGHKDSAIKITYSISDGIQGKSDPSPGRLFKGGLFEAFLPDCEMTRKLLPRLEKAFRQGLTFTVVELETGGRVMWDCIPHKTSLQGGKSGNGYPDSSYLTRLSEVLTSHGIKELPGKS